MTTGRPDQKGEELINVNNTVILTNLPIGQQMKLRDGSTAEVTANPRDGGWVRARFLESATNPALIGNEEMVFATDVVGLIDTAGLTPFAPADTGPERAVGLARPVTITTPEQSLERLLFEREIERFLYREAELLDDRRYNDWIELVAEDIH